MSTDEYYDMFKELIQTQEKRVFDRIITVQKKSTVDLMTELCIFLYSNKVAPKEEVITKFLKTKINQQAFSGLSDEKKCMLLTAGSAFLLYSEYRKILIEVYNKILAKLNITFL